jgi:hypothetical protein
MLMILQYIGRNSIIFTPWHTTKEITPSHTELENKANAIVLLERSLNYFSLSLYASDKQLIAAGESGGVGVGD